MLEGLRGRVAEAARDFRESNLARTFLSELVSAQYAYKPRLEILKSFSSRVKEKELAVGPVVSKLVHIAHGGKMKVGSDEASLGLEVEIFLEEKRAKHAEYSQAWFDKFEKIAKEKGLDWNKVEETYFVLANPSGDL